MLSNGLGIARRRGGYKHPKVRGLGIQVPFPIAQTLDPQLHKVLRNESAALGPEPKKRWIARSVSPFACFALPQ
jgi:hypothetical protein